MPLKIIRQDITKIECDAVVNPSNSQLCPGGGVDLSIHEAAGPELKKACEALGGCKVGEAKITPAFSLPCRFVIHTVGPACSDIDNASEKLASCYKESLCLAKENGCESVAIPLISSGTNGFSKEEVLRIATRVISDFLFGNEMLVYLVVFDKASFGISRRVFSDVQSYIDDKYADAYEEKAERFSNRHLFFQRRRHLKEDASYVHCEEESVCAAAPAPCANVSVDDIDDLIRNMDKSFAEMLFYHIDRKGMTDVECYKKANIDRKLFSKIRSDKNYKPSKQTVIAFAISLELDLAETEDLLKKAGFALSDSNKFDIIVEYFIVNGVYDIFRINEALFAFDQSLLGA